MNWKTWFNNQLWASHSPYAPFIPPGAELEFEPLEFKHLFTGPVEEATDAEYEAAVAEWDKRLGDGDPYPCNPFHKRIPKYGRTEPTDNDLRLDYSPGLVLCGGTSWWDFIEQKTIACGVDFDHGHGGKALDDEGIKYVDSLAEKLPYVLNCTSRGGRGRHWTIFVNPMDAKTRVHHMANCSAIITEVSRVLDVDLSKLFCKRGSILYQFHFRPSPEGFRLVKGIS